ncbi:MAG: hypothetical protein KR126chlam3_00180 [Chlamydiae bacterium]|nr:hypothetical protein [Chlamydiota bacterium]
MVEVGSTFSQAALDVSGGKPGVYGSVPHFVGAAASQYANYPAGGVASQDGEYANYPPDVAKEVPEDEIVYASLAEMERQGGYAQLSDVRGDLAAAEMRV